MDGQTESSVTTVSNTTEAVTEDQDDLGSVSSLG